MSIFRRALVVLAILAAVALLALGLFRPAGGGSKRAIGQIGQAAPLFQSTDLNGRPVALSAARGHRILLNFWASWCMPCRSEFPILQRLVANHPDVVLLGIVFEDTDASARAFLRSEGATWPGVRDPNGQVASAYGVQPKPGIPVSILIDPSGRVRHRQVGPFSDDAAVEAFVAMR